VLWLALREDPAEDRHLGVFSPENVQERAVLVTQELMCIPDR
jgi:hypothetical protein